MEENDTRCDELMIHALPRIHCKHCMIITSKRTWSTVQQQDDTLTLDKLLSICDVKLAFLGNITFGELRHLPMSAALQIIPIANHQQTNTHIFYSSKKTKEPLKLINIKLDQEEKTNTKKTCYNITSD